LRRIDQTSSSQTAPPPVEITQSSRSRDARSVWRSISRNAVSPWVSKKSGIGMPSRRSISVSTSHNVQCKWSASRLRTVLWTVPQKPVRPMRVSMLRHPPACSRSICRDTLIPYYASVLYTMRDSIRREAPELPKGPPLQNILIADDDAGIRQLLADLLTDEGYDVQEAETGEAVLQILQDKENSP